MNTRISIISLVLLFISSVSFAQNTQSDYEIQKSFKTQYKHYQNELDDASSPANVKALMDSIKVLDRKYHDHYNLLNKALYPETYAQKMDKLRESSVRTLDRLRTIKQQGQKMSNLQNQLTTYQDSFEQIRQHSDSLKRAMQKSVKSEKRLSALVRNYRKSLEKRDDLILAFIDSMGSTYQKMDLAKMQNLEKVDQKGHLKSNGDALEMIHKITQANLQTLQKNGDDLRLQDYMRMSEVQHQFQNMWNRLGARFKEVYNGKNADQLAADINKNISEWNQELSNQTLAALHDTLKASGIEINDFSNGQEFYSAVNSYLGSKIKKSKEGNSKAAYKDFKRFQQFWNRVEVQWSDSFVNAGLLTRDQMSAINGKVDMWAENAQPNSSNNIMVYLLGASVLLAVALGVMLIREKKSNGKTEA